MFFKNIFVTIQIHIYTHFDSDVKDRDVISRSEKKVSLMYKKYSEETDNHAIKGRGQKIVPIDKMNIGILLFEKTLNMFAANSSCIRQTRRRLEHVFRSSLV